MRFTLKGINVDATHGQENLCSGSSKGRRWSEGRTAELQADAARAERAEILLREGFKPCPTPTCRAEGTWSRYVIQSADGACVCVCASFIQPCEVNPEPGPGAFSFIVSRAVHSIRGLQAAPQRCSVMLSNRFRDYFSPHC